MAYKAKQVSTKRGSIKLTLKSVPFRKGFEDSIAGKPFDYDYVDRSPTKDSWRYERGRLFATIYKGKLKVGNRVEDTAVSAYISARREHLIF